MADAGEVTSPEGLAAEGAVEDACAAEIEADSCQDASAAKTLVIVALFVILACSLAGYFFTAFGGRFSKKLRTGSGAFLLAKAFSAGVILSLGFVHVLEDAFGELGSECLKENPWHKYPMATFLCMCGVLLTLFLELLTAQLHSLSGRGSSFPAHSHGSRPMGESKEVALGVDTPAKDPEAGGVFSAPKRVVADVLEIGIITHSVLIGVGLGTTTSKCTARDLLIALAFHQFFEGVALASAILEAELPAIRQMLMGLAFAVTTPIGIAIGLGIRSSYNENSQHNLITQGVFNAVTAGILIYLALVDLIAADFFSGRLTSSPKLRWGSYVCLLLGCGAMALLAYWA